MSPTVAVKISKKRLATRLQRGVVFGEDLKLCTPALLGKLEG